LGSAKDSGFLFFISGVFFWQTRKDFNKFRSLEPEKLIFKLRQVFACPFNPEVRFVENAHPRLSHSK
jgi:hypothetical protein